MAALVSIFHRLALQKFSSADNISFKVNKVLADWFSGRLANGRVDNNRMDNA